MQISVRDVDEEVYKEFKAKSVKEGLKLGKALTLAMKEWLEEEKKGKSFLKLKPFDWGEGTEKASREIDEVLYS